MMNSESWNEPWWTVNPESGDFKMSTHVVYQSFESRHQGVKCVNSSTNRLLTFTLTGSANVHYTFGWLTGHTIPRSWDYSVATCLSVLFQISRLFHWLSTFPGVSPSIFLLLFSITSGVSHTVCPSRYRRRGSWSVRTVYSFLRTRCTVYHDSNFRPWLVNLHRVL
jgi:hypothetical protein